MKLLLIAALLPAFLLTGCATVPHTVATACQPKYILGSPTASEYAKVVKVDSVNLAKSSTSQNMGVSCYGRVNLSDGRHNVPGYARIYNFDGAIGHVWKTTTPPSPAKFTSIKIYPVSCASPQGRADMRKAIKLLDRKTSVSYMTFMHVVPTENLSSWKPDRLVCYVVVRVNLNGTPVRAIPKVHEHILSHGRGLEVWESGVK